ncbi:MAG: hypothetical protein KGD57_07870 [Candidatus Lokiarchaeota archaeon]|nr:hypothetical protein [Candidatus Lokiarchaeota archaeon]
MKYPTKQEIKAYKSGKIILKLIVRPHVIFLLFKIGNLDWCDVAYSNCLNQEIDHSKYQINLQKNYPEKLKLMLVDNNSRVVKVYRVLKLSKKFTDILKDAIIEQCNNSPSLNNYNVEVKKIYYEFQPEQLAISKLVKVSCEIQGTDRKEFIELVYDKLGYGTTKKIPLWIYDYVHNKDDNKGIITKESIPDDLIKKGVVKCKYRKIADRHLYAELYKIRAVKKKRSKNKNI